MKKRKLNPQEICIFNSFHSNSHLLGRLKDIVSLIENTSSGYGVILSKIKFCDAVRLINNICFVTTAPSAAVDNISDYVDVWKRGHARQRISNELGACARRHLGNYIINAIGRHTKNARARFATHPLGIHVNVVVSSDQVN